MPRKWGFVRRMSTSSQLTKSFSRMGRNVNAVAVTTMPPPAQPTHPRCPAEGWRSGFHVTSDETALTPLRLSCCSFWRGVGHLCDGHAHLDLLFLSDHV